MNMKIQVIVTSSETTSPDIATIDMPIYMEGQLRSVEAIFHDSTERSSLSQIIGMRLIQLGMDSFLSAYYSKRQKGLLNLLSQKTLGGE